MSSGVAAENTVFHQAFLFTVINGRLMASTLQRHHLQEHSESECCGITPHDSAATESNLLCDRITSSVLLRRRRWDTL